MQVLSVSDLNIRTEVMGILPPELAALNKSSDLRSIKKKFSKQINKSEKDAIYLHYFSQSNDLTIGISDKHVSYVLVKVPESIKSKAQNLFEKAYLRLNKKEQSQLHQKDNSHEAGSYIEIKLPEEALTLKFINNDKRELYSILFWTPGEKLP